MAISQACNNAKTVKRPNQSVDKVIKSCLSVMNGIIDGVSDERSFRDVVNRQTDR